MVKVSPIEKGDFDQVLSQLADFWGDRQTEVRSLHHPMFFYEFGETGFVIKKESEILAYLLGFLLPQKKLGYIHFVGVRQDQRKQGLAQKLYEHFFSIAARAKCETIKAITTPKNEGSIQFHQALGFEMQGEVLASGVKVIKDYRAPGEDRVVFLKKILLD